jgi:epoxide hydrolase 4
VRALPHGWSEHTFDHDGVGIHYIEAGSGPLVVLLHGFPEFWYGWREQIAPLAEAGYRVIAPDLRGYNLSGKPRELSAYTVAAVAGDIGALIGKLAASNERVFLVGHDWGGIMAWVVAMMFPERIARLAVLNAPHPSAVRAAARKPAQMLRFWYQFFFQLPWLPERMLRANEFRTLRGVLRKQSMNKAAINREVLSEYVEAWSQPGAITAMLAYYRAAFRRRSGVPRGSAKRIEMPALLIWGLRDPFFTREAMESSVKWVPALRIEKLPDAGHFVQSDDPARVNALLLEFFS